MDIFETTLPDDADDLAAPSDTPTPELDGTVLDVEPDPPAPEFGGTVLETALDEPAQDGASPELAPSPEPLAEGTVLDIADEPAPSALPEGTMLDVDPVETSAALEPRTQLAQDGTVLDIDPTDKAQDGASLSSNEANSELGAGTVLDVDLADEAPNSASETSTLSDAGTVIEAGTMLDLADGTALESEPQLDDGTQLEEAPSSASSNENGASSKSLERSLEFGYMRKHAEGIKFAARTEVDMSRFDILIRTLAFTRKASQLGDISKADTKFRRVLLLGTVSFVGLLGVLAFLWQMI